MARKVLTVPSVGGNPLPYGTYFYGHDDTSAFLLNTYNASLCSVTTSNFGAPVTYRPDSGVFPFIDFKPLSGYLVRIKDTMTVTTNSQVVFPTQYVLRPGLNFFTIDQNALDQDISSFCNSTNTRIVYGTYDGTDNNDPNGTGRYFAFGTYLPTSTQNNITKFRAGSAYCVDVKAGFTITFTYPRRSQYIITDASTPSYPSYILTCENGDRLTTGVSG